MRTIEKGRIEAGRKIRDVEKAKVEKELRLEARKGERVKEAE